MLYGVTFPNGGPWADPRKLGELAHVAEEAGWEGVFIEDYLVWQGHQDMPTCDPWVGLAAMAMATERVRLGTQVTPLARRRPWQVAREMLSLDHLSGGRMVLGVGVGDPTIDVSFTHFGEATDLKVRARMLDEALEVVAGLWTGKPFSFNGEFYHIQPVALLPRPVQTPRIPLWVGGGWPLKGPSERAARWDGACLYKQAPPGSWQDMQAADILAMREFMAQRRPVGATFEICVGGRHRGEDWEKDRDHYRSLAKAGATWYTEYVPPDTYEAMRQAITRGPLTI